jgi:L-fuculose-phosphate aldolase
MTALHGQIIKTVREISRDKLVLGTWGNVSAREGKGFWITPSGMPYDQMTECDLVYINPADGKFTGCWKPSSEWRLHAEIYRRRPDCSAIVHTHSIYATAFAVARTAVLPVTEDIAQVTGGRVEVADYALSGTQELAVNAAKALGNRNAVLLAGHGLVGTAADLQEALKVCQIVEKTAQVMLLARLLGEIHVLEEEDVRRLRHFYLTEYGPGRGEDNNENIN